MLFNSQNISSSNTELATVNQKIQKLERDILALQNDNARMRTESEWRSEAEVEYNLDFIFLITAFYN